MIDDLITRIAAAMREHYLSLDRDAADADGNVPCVCGDWREPGSMGSDEDDWDRHLARIALAAIQDAYVPPPPGSDRDALPADLRALIRPHMRPYVSTACETALALDRAGTIHLPSMVTLMDWEQRMHATCRRTRKQDMANCQCDCHGGRHTVAPETVGDPE